MSVRSPLLTLALPAFLALGGTALALQDRTKPRGEPSDASGRKDDPETMKKSHMEMPKPTKEHAWLKKRVGTWEATVHCPMMGSPSKATETVKPFGEFWVVADFQGEFMGEPMKGLSLMTYDPLKKKFVSTWSDTMWPALMVMEGTLDPGEKKLTTKGKGPNMEHEIVEFTGVMEVMGPDETTFTLYETEKGPSDPSAMKIEYKRRK